MALKPKTRSGPSASVSVTTPALRGLPRSTRRQPSGSGSEYERVRLREVEHRAELYALKVARLRAEVLDRAEVEAAFSEIVSAIKQVIDRSRLSRSEKAEICANLLTPAEFAANVAHAQQADRAKGEASLVVGNGGIDQAL